MRNIKIQTALIFFVLLCIGMLLVEFVAMRLWRQQAQMAAVEHARSLLRVMATRLPAGQDEERFVAEMARISGKDGAVPCFGAMAARGDRAYLSPGCGAFAETMEKALRETTATGREFNWPANAPDLPGNTVLLAQPVRTEDGGGAVAMVRSLSPLSSNLRKNEGIIFGYVVINAVILTVVGLFRMLRLVMRPLENLAEQADAYSIRHDFLPFPSRGGNELGRLSSSLNLMISQIEEDRTQLRQKVDSLRLANEELERNRREMVRAEKMASIGRLAAGLAHEIGNPLGVVQGYLDLLGQGESSPGERKEFARRAEQEVTRVGRLIRQLLDYARPGEGAPSPVRVRELLAESLELFRHGKAHAHIAFSLRPEADEDLVLADADGLRQIFVNCFMNAVDAVGSLAEGRVTARCFNEQEGERRYIRVVIEDNGPGIAKEHLESVFEPFFTTKEPGRGTGLGLAVSCSLVEKWGGRMWAESGRAEDGGGAAIWISLPLAAPGGGAGSLADNDGGMTGDAHG